MKNQHVFVGTLITSILFAGSFVFAAITSGGFTWNSSTDVTLTQVTVTKPTSVQGDLLLANVSFNGGSPAVVTPPSGWTLILRTDNDSDIGIASYYKIAGASEPSSYTWSVSPQTTAVGAITAYSGVVAGYIEAAAGNSGRGTVATTSSITTTTANAQIVALFAIDAGKSGEAGTYFAPPAGMTEKYDVSNTPFGPSTASDETVQVSPGIVHSKSATITGNKQRNWVSQVIALRSTLALTDGLIHYWKLDEASGDAVDAVGSMTLVNVNSTQYTAGKINNGADFEHDDSTFLRSSTDLTTRSLTAYSMCMWYKPESVPDEGTANSLWTSYDTSGFFDLLYINPTDGISRLWFRHFLPGQDSVIVESVGELSTMNFSHVCATWDGATLNLYVDGGLAASPSAAGAIRVDDTLFGTTIGGQSISETSVFNVSDGIIDEVGVWDRGLSATEVGQLYNSGTGVQYPF